MGTENPHDLSRFGGRLIHPDTAKQLYGSAAPAEPHWDFGWIPFAARSAQMTAVCDNIVQTTPQFRISGGWQLDQKRYSLWAAYKKLTGKFLPYNHQLTGSCIGAGGGNMAKTLMAVETLLGNMEYKELFWPYTYGKSRQRDGSRSQGEGSSGTSYAAAATEDGYVAFDEDVAGVGSPTYGPDGWLTLTAAIEMKWSNGLAAPDKDVQIGKLHLIKAKAKINSSDDGIAAIANGYPITEASNFGLRAMVPAPQGNPAVRLGKWDGNWSHQMFVDEIFQHPTLGMLFRVGNNWGFSAHGTATGDEPPGGFYITAATFDQICRSGEVWAFSGSISGFEARNLNAYV